jgi:alkylation response protein AidB-like acyl-CoA dehydrogenase
MDLNYSPEETAFRDEVRDWLVKNLPDDLRVKVLEYVELSKDDLRRWHQILARKGWVAPDWPVEWGGTGWNVVQRYIWEEECGYAGTPPLIAFGLRMCAPVLFRFGSDAQKQRYLPKIYSGEEFWCQGYSEPGSGSDLASLKTRAEIDGDDFVVNGQKVWTSAAHLADWMFGLVRTDPNAPKHKGISYVLIDMKTPGITVRPLVQMTGEPGFNEVFFNDVRVPRTNLVGTLHQGWMVANSTLHFERNMLASTTRTQQLMGDLIALAQRRTKSGGKASRDPAVRQRLADLQIRTEAMRFHALKQLSDEINGRPPGIGASINKLVTTELNHDICAGALEVLGSYGQLAKGAPHVEDRGAWPKDHMFTLGMIIGGGTSQIQKNIISERGLGLPKGA